MAFNYLYTYMIYLYSHPKYRAALQAKFPSLVCGATDDDTKSTASGATNVTTAEEKVTA